MTTPYVGEIKVVGFNFAPRGGWMLCDGRILSMSDYQDLADLIGTTYGEGETRGTFALPDLRGRTPIHVGDGHQLGNRGGVEDSELIPNQIPSHTHSLNAVNASANQPSPADNLLAVPPAAVGNIYSSTSPTLDQNLDSSTIQKTGQDQGHANKQPFQVLNFVIAVEGIIPSR